MIGWLLLMAAVLLGGLLWFAGGSLRGRVETRPSGSTLAREIYLLEVDLGIIEPEPAHGFDIPFHLDPSVILTGSEAAVAMGVTSAGAGVMYLPAGVEYTPLVGSRLNAGYHADLWAACPHTGGTVSTVSSLGGRTVTSGPRCSDCGAPVPSRDFPPALPTLPDPGQVQYRSHLQMPKRPKGGSGSSKYSQQKPERPPSAESGVSQSKDGKR